MKVGLLSNPATVRLPKRYALIVKGRSSCDNAGAVISLEMSSTSGDTKTASLRIARAGTRQLTWPGWRVLIKIAKSVSPYLVRAFGLLITAVIITIALGQLFQYNLQSPLFLGSIGAIRVGSLFGPLAGAIIGWAAGYALPRGAFERFHTVVLAGFLVGLGAALLSAPIAAYQCCKFTRVS